MPTIYVLRAQFARSRCLAVTLIALHLLVLHRADGGEVIVAAGQITSLRSPAGPLSKLAPAGGCVVWMTDSRFVAVLESCREVQRQLEVAP